MSTDVPFPEFCYLFWYVFSPTAICKVCANTLLLDRKAFKENMCRMKNGEKTLTWFKRDFVKSSYIVLCINTVFDALSWWWSSGKLSLGHTTGQAIHFHSVYMCLFVSASWIVTTRRWSLITRSSWMFLEPRIQKGVEIILRRTVFFLLL